MATSDHPELNQCLNEPLQMADILGRRPVATSPPDGWEDVVLHRFNDLPTRIDVPAMRNEVLVCHLGGPFLAEVGVGTPRFERRWIGPGQLGIRAVSGHVGS